MKQLILSALVLITSCAGEGSQTEQQTTAASEETSDVLPIQPQGKLRFFLENEELAQDSEAYLVESELSAKMLGGSEFLIEGLETGSYDLIIVNKAIAYANRINKILVKESAETIVTEVKLYPSLELTGKIYENESPCVGAKVYIPGTQWSTTTDDSGQFSLPAVSRGPHRLLIEKAGFHTGRIEGLNIAKDYQEEKFVLEDIQLWPEELSGPMALSNTSSESPASQTTVSVGLIPPNTANQIRIGTSRFLDRMPWQPLKTSWKQEFLAEGNYSVFVQYANNGQQISQVLEANVYIQLTQP